MWSDPDVFPTWFCPAPPWVCTVVAYDFRPGGAYRVRMVAPDKDVYELFGEFETIEPETTISLSWNWEDSPSHPAPSHVQIAFGADADGTKLVITHSRFLSPDSRGRHEEGWGAVIGRLETALATP